jgi:hypothetical protein
VSVRRRGRAGPGNQRNRMKPSMQLAFGGSDGRHHATTHDMTLILTLISILSSITQGRPG